jgi:hypothetical protein
MANWTAPYCSLAQFFSDLVRSHIAALSQNIGAEGRGEGSLLNAAIFESPPPPAYWPTSPKAEKGLRFTRKKLDGNTPSSPQRSFAHPLQADATFRNADFSRQC